MKEVDPLADGDPRLELAILLSTDFAAIEIQLERQEALDGGNVFGKIIDQIASTGRVQDKMESAEVSMLAGQVDQLLAMSYACRSFKDYIIGQIVNAYIWEDKVDESVSPDNLGIISGEGIFDREEAQAIEKTAIRLFLSNAVESCIMIQIVDNKRTPVVVNPELYEDYMKLFDSWLKDYASLYGEDALDGETPAAVVASIKGRLPDEHQLRELVPSIDWDEIMKTLDQLRKNRQQ